METEVRKIQKAVKSPSGLSFSLEISDVLEQKIRCLCDIFKDKEWSGIMFYKKEGEIGQKNFKAEALDVCLMDIGTGGFTEFDDSQDVIMYMVEHEELLQKGIYEGLIHSHNQMPAYFSGTDTSTLEKEGRNTNHFLSLIVNNAGEYTARITRRVECCVESKIVKNSNINSEYHTFENKLVKTNPSFKQTTENTKECYDVVEWFEAKINVPNVTVEHHIKQELEERIDMLKSRIVEKPITKTQTKYPEFRQLSFDFDNTWSYETPAYGIIRAAETLCYRLATGNLFDIPSYFSEMYLKTCLKSMPEKYERMFTNIENNQDFEDFMFGFICALTDFSNPFLGKTDYKSEDMYAIIEEVLLIIDANVPECHVKHVIIETITDLINYYE